MAITQIKKGLKNGAYNYCLFVCDEESDVADLPNDDGVCAGSEALVISERKKYILNSSGEWKLVIDYALGGAAGIAVLE